MVQEPWINKKILGLGAAGATLYRGTLDVGPRTCILTKGVTLKYSEDGIRGEVLQNGKLTAIYIQAINSRVYSRELSLHETNHWDDILLQI